MKTKKLTEKELEHFNFYVEWEKLTKEEADDLKAFLQDKTLGDFYKSIFEELTIDDAETSDYQPDPHSIKPLEIFRLLDEKKELVKNYKDDPFLVVSHLAKNIQCRHKLQHKYFLYSLVDLLKFLQIYDSDEFINCRNYMESLLESINISLVLERGVVEIEKWVSPNFIITEFFLEKLPDTQSKIRHLKEILIECEFFHLEIESCGDKSVEGEYEKQTREKFMEKCKIHIKRYEKLLELENEGLEKTVTLEEGQIESKDNIKKHKDLTLDRAALFFNYLFSYAKADCHNTKKAEVISFLTGFSNNTIRQKLSNLYSKDNDKSLSAYKEDMRIVRKYFEELGLSEIVDLIDRELKS